MDQGGEKKCSYLDEFRILKTLGAGYHAQVKLGLGEDGNLYAIKRYKKETANLSTLQHELNIMKNLDHENLVRLVDVREDAQYKKKDETSFRCFAIILEFMGGGELFDFIAETGRFSERVSRTYFHQMMNGLYYMHSQGYAHRDIKPENILLGQDFGLKIADFGFSCLLQGKDNSGILHTKLGTQGYMAPEIASKNYEGAKIDIFATGVILFIMYAGTPPFEKTTPNDPYYRLIKEKKYDTFWKAHSRKKPADYFNDVFKDLFVRMCAFDSKERPPVEEIANHPWVKGTICSTNQINVQFSVRLKKLREIQEIKKKKEEQKREKLILQSMQTMTGSARGIAEDVDIDLLQHYEAEEDNAREIQTLEIVNPDDFVIEENIVYAVALLKNFFSKRDICIDEDMASKERGEEQVDEDLVLRPIELEDQNDVLSVVYERRFNVDGKQYEESLEISVRLGNAEKGGIVVQVNHKKGNWFYFKRVAKEIKKMLKYCQKK